MESVCAKSLFLRPRVSSALLYCSIIPLLLLRIRTTTTTTTYIYSGWIRRGKRVIMSFGPFLPSSTQSPLKVIFRNASLAVMMVDGEPLVVSVSCWLVKYTNYLRVLPLRRRRGVSKIISFQSEHQQQQQHNLPPHLSLILCWGLCSKRTLWQSRRGELIEHVH